jgi:hypothetical protein
MRLVVGIAAVVLVLGLMVPSVSQAFDCRKGTYENMPPKPRALCPHGYQFCVKRTMARGRSLEEAAAFCIQHCW